MDKRPVFLSSGCYHTWLRLGFRWKHKKAYDNLQRLRKIVTSESYSYQPFDTFRCVFVHVPKCAGISVSQALFGNLSGGHATLSDYLYVFEPKLLASYFKFTIVRNPWDRLVSAYHFLQQGGYTEADQHWAKENLGQYRDFGSFVKQWLNAGNIWKWPHFQPQHHYFLDRARLYAMDFVGFFENLDEDFAHIANRIGRDCTLEKMNASNRKDYKDYYDQETMNIVARIYADDIALLGYAFDNSSLQTQVERRNTAGHRFYLP